MSRRQNKQRVNHVVKVNNISICNSNEISKAFKEQFSTIYRAQTREKPLYLDEESIYWNNISEKLQQILFSSNC